MRLVVPTEPHREIGEVHRRVGLDLDLDLDLERSVLQPVTTQHPLHRNADVAVEHPLGGARAPRRTRHDLFDAMRRVVVANPVHQRAQRPVIDGASGAIEFCTSVFGATLIEKMDMAGGPFGTEIAHAELDSGDGRLQLSDPHPDYDLEAPERKEAVYDVVARVEQVDAEERDRRLAEWAKGNV